MGQVETPPLAQGAGVSSPHPEIVVEWLPSYAPELNPEEYCHGNVKERMCNRQPDTVGEIEEQVNRSFDCLSRRPDLLFSFFHHATPSG